MHGTYELPVRAAAKAVLFSGDDVLLVAGHSGRLNLPGGGIDHAETPLQALYRELNEELGLEHDHLRGIEEAGVTEGVVTTRGGTRMLARWSIFIAQMDIPLDEMIIGEDIHCAVRASREDVLQYTAPYVSDMALRAVQRTT